MKVQYVDGAYRTFTAAVPADLAGKEGYAVEMTAAGKIQLKAAGLEIGVLHQRLDNGEDWTVRLLGKSGTVRMVQGAAVAPGARVAGEAGGKVITAVATDRSLGIKIHPATNGADGDVIEVMDVVEILPA